MLTAQPGYQDSVLRFARKTCQACGSECLDTDPRCWACGGWDFAPAAGAAASADPAVDPAGGPDRTLTDGDDWQPTLSWRRDRRALAMRRWAMTGAAVAAVGAVAVLGFWVGRSTAPEPPAGAAAVAARPFEPQVLPRPRVEPFVPPAASVQIHPLPPLPAQNAAPTVSRPFGPSVSSPGVPAWRAAAPAPVNPTPPVVARPLVTTPPNVPAPPNPAALPPNSKLAVLSLRNVAPVPVDLRFEGFNGAEDSAIRIAAGAAFEFPVGPGDYRLHAIAADCDPGTAKAVFASRQRYAVVVDASQPGSGGRMALNVRQPAAGAQ